MRGSTAWRFSLRVTPTVRRALAERFPEPVAFAAFEFINGPLLDNPHRVGRRLLPPLDDRHSARRGSYRIIYRIDDKARTVTVVDVDHRSNDYKSH
ncbi:MAG: type II toxin-antitoxin system RelE family toxin [Pseudonocardiales bacterium]